MSEVQRSRRRLTRLVDLLLTSAGSLPYVVDLPNELIDENGQVAATDQIIVTTNCIFL